MLERDRQEFEQEDRDVEADAPRDLEHGRLLRRVQGERVEVPGQAEVGEESDRHEGVAQQAHQDGGAAEPVEILALEDVDHAGHRERTRGHRDPHQVEEDPQAPRVGVGEIGAAAEPQGEARDQRDATERHEQQEDPVERGQHLAQEGLELDVAVVLGMLRRGRSVCHRLSPLPEEGVRGAEQGAHGHHGGGHGVERRLGEGRKGLLSVRRKAELLERHSGQVQHARPAQLLLSVDVVDVPVGPVGDALVRERQHLLPGAVAQGVGGARLDAGGSRDGLEELLARVVGQRLPVERDRHRLIGAVGAVRALRDLRGARVPFRGRHVPGTRQHAVAAADAVVGVVRHRTVGLPEERRRRARGDAGRLQAVEAPLHDEGRFDASRLLRVRRLVERDEGQRLRAERRRVLEAQLVLELGRLAVALVPLLAGHLAGSAADAVGDVDQRRPDRAGGCWLASCASPR